MRTGQILGNFSHKVLLIFFHFIPSLFKLAFGDTGNLADSRQVAFPTSATFDETVVILLSKLIARPLK